MKKLLPILIFVVFGAVHPQTPDNSDSVSVKKIVQMQIENALQKKNRTHSEIAANKTNKKIETKLLVKPSSLSLLRYTANPLYIKIGIMILASLTVFVWVFLRRRRKKSGNDRLKENIGLMRREKFIKNIDPQLKEIRTKLCLTASTLSNEKEVTAKARQMNIAKGELMLAMKMKGSSITNEASNIFRS